MRRILSIVMPVFNGQKYLSETIDSILNQTFHNWELIIIDDGSTDKTESIINTYLTKDSRIKYYKRNRLPKGAQTCRNIGFEYAKDSEYVIFMDSDDIAAAHCFMQRVSYMQSHPDLDFSVFPSRTFSKSIEEPLGLGNGIKLYYKNDIENFLWGEFPFIVWNNIYRTSSLVEKKLSWDERIKSLQDTDYNLQSIFRQMKYEYAENAYVDFYYRYVDNGKATHVKVFSKEHTTSHLYLLNKIFGNLLESQLNRFELPLKNYLLIYLHRFLICKNIKAVLDLFKIPWLKGRYWFKLRMTIYSVIAITAPFSLKSNKLFGILFPRIYIARRNLRNWNIKIVGNYFISHTVSE